MVLVSIQTVSAAIIGIEHAISLNTYDFISCRSAADYQNLKFHISEDAKAKVSIYNAQNQLMNETPLYSCDIGFNQIALRFNSDNGDYYSDGQYKVVLYVEENYNATANRSYEKPNIIIDNTPPGINYTTASQYFSPNGDGENDQVTITGLCTENSIIEAKIYFSEYWDNRSEIKRLQIQNGLSFSYSWDGTNNLNELMDDGVYYLGIQNDKTIIKNKDIQPKTNIQNTVTGASEASDISVVTRDPQIFTIDNWKVHRDDEYGITISYPPNWSVSSYTKNETEVPRILLVNGGTSLFFYPYSNPDAGECPVKVIKKEDIKVGDEIISFGYYITRNTTQLSACADLNASSPVGKKFRNINFLLTSYKDAEEVDMKIVKQILSTFKSTN